MNKKKSALMLLVGLALAGCSAQQGGGASATATGTPAAAATQSAQLQKNALGDGLYEMALTPDGRALYVASAQGFKDVQGGAIYKLDPATLKVLGITHTDLKNFGVAMDPQGKTLYVTNSLDGGVSALDIASGKITGRLLFSERNEKGFPYGAREILWHDGQLFIGGVADPGVIWVVDAKTLKLKKRINNAGKWVTGLHYSAQTQRLYTANGGGEILVINPRSYAIEQRWQPLGEKPALLLNLAEDKQGGRLFVTDNSKAKTTLVLDIRSGKLIKQLDNGDSLAVKYNPQRQELYLTQRESGKLLILDAHSYATKRSVSLPPHPNSLLLSADGQTLYVTVKQAFNKDGSTQGPDSIVRVPLNQ
ncbi:YncE family protein [Serratia rubidaea]|nr:YncE family protein [Serratia rubidaea]